jgi:predicted DNA-binding WGR domain protein
MATEKKYLEFSDGTSHKFYEAWVENKTAYIRYGRIGTDGTTQVKDFPSTDKAEDFITKKLKEKTDKGYAAKTKGDTEKKKVVKATDEVDIDYIKSAPFAPDHWKKFKAAYKTSEAALDKDLLPHFIVRLDAAKQEDLQKEFPTRATLRYMKRRTRRFLKNLDDAAYLDIVPKLLLAFEKQPALDGKHHWATLDILYGNSRRFKQAAHGQGDVRLDTTKFHLKHIEDRRAELWDKNPRLLEPLLTKALPWQIHEFAARVVTRNKFAIPKLERAIIESCFASESVLLRQIAKKQTFAAFKNDEPLSAKEAAGLYFTSSESERETLRKLNLTSDTLISSFAKKLGLSKGDSDWKKDFAETLFAHSLAAFKGGLPSRRGAGAMAYLAKNFKETIGAKDLLPLAAAIFKTQNDDLAELIYESAKRVKAQFPVIKERIKASLTWFAAVQTDAQFKKLSKVFLESVFADFKNSYYQNDFVPFIKNEAKYVNDFGYKLADQALNQWTKAYLWMTVTKRVWNIREKRPQLLTNLSQSDVAASFFSKAFKDNNNNYYIVNDYYTPLAFKLHLIRNGIPTWREMIVREVGKALKQNPLDQLWVIANFPKDLRDEIWNGAKINANQIFKNNYWSIRQVFAVVEPEDEAGREAFAWMWTQFYALLDEVKFDKALVNNILYYIYASKKKLWEWVVNRAKPEYRAIFIDVLSLLIPTYSAEQLSEIPEPLLTASLDKLPLESVVELIRSCDDTSWEKFKQSVYKRLLSFGDKSNFWKVILERVIASEDAVTLGARLIDDKAFYALFITQKNTDILQLDNPVFEQALLDWAKNNETLFAPNTALLYKLCTHKLTSLREFGLKRAAENMDVPFALSLLESGLPPAMETAKNYIQSLESSSQKLYDAALAFCDSPKKDVRHFGIALLQNHKGNLLSPKSAMLEQLTEHADAEVHHVVAKELAVQNAAGEFVKRFDKEILRMKNRSRKAKDDVKARLDKSLATNADVLLEVARSNNKGDAEWAIVQLTKLVISGQEVDGFAVK